ncbi:MAG: alpha-ketoglutarate-dependent dioxygenase AlkB [Nitratireductor sp.]
MNVNGAQFLPNFYDIVAQRTLVDEIREIVRQAPLYTPTMPKTGKSLSVKMTNCGALGWVSDASKGYRYQDHHPRSGKAWPAIPEQLLKLWESVVDAPIEPEACLINFYDANAKMGLHQDNDETDLTTPVVSVSLGDSCLFRIGTQTRSGKTKSFKLNSGDVVVLGGEARLAFHGVDKIYPGTSTLLKNEGRINLTLRRVSK